MKLKVRYSDVPLTMLDAMQTASEYHAAGELECLKDRLNFLERVVSLLLEKADIDTVKQVFSFSLIEVEE